MNSAYITYLLILIIKFVNNQKVIGENKFMDESKQNNLQWLNERYPIKPKKWHTEQVLRIHEVEHFRFYSHNPTKSYKDVIDPMDIKGIQYAYAYNDGCNITWVDLLNSLKRFKDIRQSNMYHRELVEHAQNDYNEPRTVSKYGSLYFTTTGQHRMVLCKFLDLKEVEVNINEYTFNNDKFNTYKIRKRFIEQLMERNLITEELSDSNLLTYKKGVRLNIHSVFMMIEDKVFDRFINLYDNLSTNKILMAFESLIYGRPSTFNNEISNYSDLAKFKHYLRKSKADNL